MTKDLGSRISRQSTIINTPDARCILLTRVSDLPILCLAGFAAPDPRSSWWNRPIDSLQQARSRTPYNGGADDGHIWNSRCWTIKSEKTILQNFWEVASRLINYPMRPSDQGFDESLISPSGGMGQVVKILRLSSKEIGAILILFYGTIMNSKNFQATAPISCKRSDPNSSRKIRTSPFSPIYSFNANRALPLAIRNTRILIQA